MDRPTRLAIMGPPRTERRPMEFEIACTCGQHMLVDSQYVGQEVACPGCGGLLTTPDAPRGGDPVPVLSPMSLIPDTPPVPPPVSPAPPSPSATPLAAADVYDEGRLAGVKRTHGRAVAALICGILSLGACPPLILSIISLVLAGQAKRDIRMNPDLYTGLELATAAQVCAVIGLFGGCIVGGCLLPMI